MGRFSALMVGVVLLSFGGGVAHGQSTPKGLEDIVGGTYTNAVRTLVRARCRAYGHIWQRNVRQCRAHATILARTLDLKSKTPPGGSIGGGIFMSDLERVIESEEGRAFIRDTHRFMDANQDVANAGNLWDWTLGITRGDSRKAVLWLGTLFQDTSEALGVVNYLKAAYPDRFELEIGMVEEMSVWIRQGIAFDPYPTAVGGPIGSRAQYHLYTLAIAAQKVRQNGGNANFSVAAPFLFNLTYEYFTHGLIPGMDRVPAAPGDFHLWPFLQTASQLFHPTDPARIDPVTHREALEDTYLGLAGAYLGATGRIPVTFETFVRDFAKDPAAYVRRVFFR